MVEYPLRPVYTMVYTQSTIPRRLIWLVADVDDAYACNSNTVSFTDSSLLPLIKVINMSIVISRRSTDLLVDVRGHPSHNSHHSSALGVFGARQSPLRLRLPQIFSSRTTPANRPPNMAPKANINEKHLTA